MKIYEDTQGGASPPDQTRSLIRVKRRENKKREKFVKQRYPVYLSQRGSYKIFRTMGGRIRLARARVSILSYRSFFRLRNFNPGFRSIDPSRARWIGSSDAGKISSRGGCILSRRWLLVEAGLTITLVNPIRWFFGKILGKKCHLGGHVYLSVKKLNLTINKLFISWVNFFGDLLMDKIKSIVKKIF